MSRRRDLTGQKFGKLTAIRYSYTIKGKAYWECECECGNKKTVRANELLTGGTKSCGCSKIDAASIMGHERLENLEGKTFGKWTVLSLECTKPETMWLCQCECGTIKKVSALHLKRGDSTSCGCVNKVDLTGRKFGRLTAIKKTTSGKNPKWLCKCDCGVEKEIQYSALTSGKTVSCGCYFKEVASKSNTKHLMSRSKIYAIYMSMQQRCYNPMSQGYNRYGGRGITISPNWMGENGFATFAKWAIQNGYEEGLSIDRIDVNGNYCPENCRWITIKEQERNKRNTIFIEVFGIRKPLVEWVELMNLPYSTYYYRYNKGLEVFNENELKKIKEKLRSENL